MALAGVLGLTLLGWGNAVLAGSLSYCQGLAEPPAPVQDRLIQVASVVKDELGRSGHRLALISRSGLALEHLGHRYSHAGVSLRDSAHTPWSVRQLYFACDEQRPRIFDQGLTGFVMGTHDPAEGYISIVLLPPDASVALERAALDDGQAVQLLAANYSANAYAFSARYQNCNQWVAELLASAWQSNPDEARTREQAQQWLRTESYQPSVIKLHWQPLMWVAALLPWLHQDDHPAEDIAQAQFRISMPLSIETFAQARHPQATRIELCYTGDRLVLRRGWEPIADGCQAAEGDEVRTLLN